MRHKSSSTFAKWSFLSSCLIFLTAGTLKAAKLNISASDPALFKSLLADATSQYTGTITASTVFPGDFNFIVTGKKPFVAPPPSNPIPDGTAFDRCFVHGWVFGSENERQDILNIFQGLQYDISKSTSCGGAVVSPSATPAQAFLGGCSTAYGVATSTVTQRNGLPPAVLVPPFPPLIGGN